MVALDKMLTMDMLRSNRHRLSDWNEIISKTRRTLSMDPYKRQNVKKASATEALETLGPLVSGQDARLAWRSRAFIAYYVQAIANSRQLNFAIGTANGDQLLRVTGECYAFHIWLDGTENSSYVKEVQLLFGDRDTPMKCAELTEELKKGNFEELKVHLDGLEDVFSIPGNKSTRMKSFLSLQSLEEDLCKLSQLYAPGFGPSGANAAELSGIARLRSFVNAALIGVASARSGGRAARLLFYVSPRDIVTAVCREQKNSGNVPDTFYSNPKALWRHNLGFIIGLQIKSSNDGTENQMPFIPLVTLQRGQDGVMQPHFSPPTNVNHAPLPAHFSLKFERKIVIPMSHLKRIEEITGIPLNLGDGHDLIDLLMQVSQLDSEIYSSNLPVFVKYMSSHQIYHFSCSLRGHVVESLPFLSPRQLPQLIDVLREVANFQTLICSILNAAQDSQSDRRLDFVSVYHVYVRSLTSLHLTLKDIADDTDKPLSVEISLNTDDGLGACVTNANVSWPSTFLVADPTEVLRSHHSLPMMARWIDQKLLSRDEGIVQDAQRMLLAIENRQLVAQRNRRRPALAVDIADEWVKIQSSEHLLKASEGPRFDLTPGQPPACIPALRPNAPPAPPPPPRPPTPPTSHAAPQASASQLDELLRDTKSSQPTYTQPAVQPSSHSSQQQSQQSQQQQSSSNQQSKPTTHTDPDKNSVLVSLLNEESMGPLGVRGGQMGGGPTPITVAPAAIPSATLLRSNSNPSAAQQRSMLPPQNPPVPAPHFSPVPSANPPPPQPPTPPPPHYHPPIPQQRAMTSPIPHMMSPSPRQSPVHISPTPDINRQSPIRPVMGVMGMSPHPVPTHVSPMPAAQSQAAQPQYPPMHLQQRQQQELHQLQQQQAQQQPMRDIHQLHQQQVQQQPMRPPSGGWAGSSPGGNVNPATGYPAMQQNAPMTAAGLQVMGSVPQGKTKKPRKRRAAPSDISKQAPSNVKRRLSDSESSNPPGSAGFDVNPENSLSVMSRGLPTQQQMDEHQQNLMHQEYQQQHHQQQQHPQQMMHHQHQQQSQHPNMQPSQQSQQAMMHHHQQQQFQQHQQQMHHPQQQMHQQHHPHAMGQDPQFGMNPAVSGVPVSHPHMNMGSQPPASSSGAQFLYSQPQYNMKRTQGTPVSASQQTKMSAAMMGSGPCGTHTTQLANLLESGNQGHSAGGPMPIHPGKNSQANSGGMSSQPAKDPYEFDDTAPTHLPTPHSSWTTSTNAAQTAVSGIPSTGMQNSMNTTPASAVIVSSTCNDSVKPSLKLTIRSAPSTSGGALESVLNDKKDKSNCFVASSIPSQNSLGSVSLTAQQLSKKSKKLKNAGKPQNLTDLIHQPTSYPSMTPMPLPDIPGTTVLPIGQLPPQVPIQFMKKQRKRKRESPGGLDQISPTEKKKEKKKPGRKKKDLGMSGPVAILPNVGNAPPGMAMQQGMMVPGNSNYMPGAPGIVNNGQLGAQSMMNQGMNNEQKQPPLKVSFHAKNKDAKGRLSPGADMAKMGGLKGKEKKMNAGAPGEKLGNGAVASAPGGRILSVLTKSNFKIPKKKSGDSPNSSTTATVTSDSISPTTVPNMGSVSPSSMPRQPPQPHFQPRMPGAYSGVSGPNPRGPRPHLPAGPPFVRPPGQVMETPQMIDQQQQQMMDPQMQRAGAVGVDPAMGKQNRKGTSISMVIDKLHERRGRGDGNGNGGNGGGNGAAAAAQGNRNPGDNIFEKFRGSGAGSTGNDSYEVMKSTKDTPDSPESIGALAPAPIDAQNPAAGAEKVIPVTRSGEPAGEVSTTGLNTETPNLDT